MCPVRRHGLNVIGLAFQHWREAVPTNEPCHFRSPGKLSADRAFVADGVPFAGGSRGSGSTVSGGVPASDADAV